MVHDYKQTVKLADGTVKEVNKLTRREILANIEELSKKYDVNKLWSNSKR